MGLTEAELQLCELLGQVIELLRWNQVLGYSNQYLLQEKLGLSVEERSGVMKAAAAAVEQDGRIQDWGRRLIEIQDALQRIQLRMLSDAPAGDLGDLDVDEADDGASEDGDGRAEAANG